MGTSSRDEMSGKKEQSLTKKDPSLTAALAQATLPQWLTVSLMLSLIFGGCCANVLALEALIREVPGSGTLITFAQFLLTSLVTLPNYVSWSRGSRNFYLKERGIPFRKWLIYTAFFVTINILNNKAFDYKISLPLHVILRSAGPVTSMSVGFLFGRRYSKTQIFAVFLLTIGVVLAALADAQAKGSKISFTNNAAKDTFKSTQSRPDSSTTGFIFLFVALLLSALMGVYTDRVYSRYGRNHWGENLFYSHTLSLPLFFFQYSDLKFEFSKMLLSQPLTIFTTPTTSAQLSHSLIPSLILSIPSQPIFLLLNALTQYLCIRGVNLLSAKSSSLTVTIVLNVRKLVSLLLSIWLFGNKLPTGVMIGAIIVFLGAGIYALPKSKSTTTKTSLDPTGNGQTNSITIGTGAAMQSLDERVRSELNESNGRAPAVMKGRARQRKATTGKGAIQISEL